MDIVLVMELPCPDDMRVVDAEVVYFHGYAEIQLSGQGKGVSANSVLARIS